VDMGTVRHGPEAVNFDASGLSSSSCGGDTLWHLPLPDGSTVALSLVGISNPHAVMVVDDVDQTPVDIIGPYIESHPRFAKRVNVGFMQVLGPNSIRLRVFERGAGETLACGTGACAASVAGIRRGLLTSPVKVFTRGGPLTIQWQNDR